jgi:soluble lytic murein transglycosylase-like protein
MKKLLCILLLQWLFGCGLVAHAADGVYAFTANDGSVSLSNVPADDRYQVLIAGQNNNAPVVALAAPVVVVQKPHHLLADKARYKRIVDDAARSYGLDSALLHAVISVESRYDPTVVSKTGAVGLMQLMPATARRYGVTDSFDAEQNLHGGAKYLRDLLLMFDNDVSLALAAYNAGESAVIKHGNHIPPNRETRKYVPKVLGYYRKYRKEL